MTKIDSKSDVELNSCHILPIRATDGVYIVRDWQENYKQILTHWGPVTHICISKLTSIGSDNVLAPGRCQAIIWTNAGILFIWTLRNKLQWNFNQSSYIFIQEKIWKCHLEKWWPPCLGLNVLRVYCFRLLARRHSANMIECCIQKPSALSVMQVMMDWWMATIICQACMSQILVGWGEVGGLKGVCENKIWWLCLVLISATRFASDLGYRMAKNLIGLYKEILFMNYDIKLLNTEWRTRYSLTNFEDHFGLHQHASIIF